MHTNKSNIDQNETGLTLTKQDFGCLESLSISSYELKSSGHFRNSKFQINMTRIIRSSKYANLLPKHPLGPNPKDKFGPAIESKARLPSSFVTSHLSGLNMVISFGSHDPV